MMKIVTRKWSEKESPQNKRRNMYLNISKCKFCCSTVHITNSISIVLWIFLTSIEHSIKKKRKTNNNNNNNKINKN